MKMKKGIHKIFENPHKAIRIVNILFLSLLLIYILSIIVELNLGLKTLDCLRVSGFVLLVLCSSWVNSARPFVDKIERLKNKRK